MALSEPHLWVFLLASIAVILTPGQDMLLVLSRSVAQGSRAGIATAAGVSGGLLGHTCLAAVGLGAMLSASEAVFTGIKLFGAAYLGYLGLKLLRAKSADLTLAKQQGMTLGKLFWQGALSNLGNPKITIFYFAFLPQFVPGDTDNIGGTLFFLGALFAILTFIIKAPIGYGAGSLSSWLRSRPGVQVWLNRCSGMVLIGLGLRLAFEKRG